jgi:MtN3 and saliva related transmembrane protein
MVTTIILINTIGFLAGIIQTSKTVPQLVLSLKRKCTKDLSLLMVSFGLAGTFLWLIYGILVKSLPIMVTDSISTLLFLTLLVVKIRFHYLSDCKEVV